MAARAASRLRPDCILPSHGSVRGIREIGAPVNYYDSAIGQTGAALKSTLHDIIDGHTVLPYTSGGIDTWDAFKVLDEDAHLFRLHRPKIGAVDRFIRNLGSRTSVAAILRPGRVKHQQPRAHRRFQSPAMRRVGEFEPGQQVLRRDNPAGLKLSRRAPFELRR